jgi:hypothetical protein
MVSFNQANKNKPPPSLPSNFHRYLSIVYACRINSFGYGSSNTLIYSQLRPYLFFNITSVLSFLFLATGLPLVNQRVGPLVWPVLIITARYYNSMKLLFTKQVKLVPTNSKPIVYYFPKEKLGGPLRQLIKIGKIYSTFL